MEGALLVIYLNPYLGQYLQPIIDLMALMRLLPFCPPHTFSPPARALTEKYEILKQLATDIISPSVASRHHHAISSTPACPLKGGHPWSRLSLRHSRFWHLPDTRLGDEKMSPLSHFHIYHKRCLSQEGLNWRPCVIWVLFTQRNIWMYLGRKSCKFDTISCIDLSPSVRYLFDNASSTTTQLPIRSCWNVLRQKSTAITNTWVRDQDDNRWRPFRLLTHWPAGGNTKQHKRKKAIHCNKWACIKMLKHYLKNNKNEYFP